MTGPGALGALSASVIAFAVCACTSTTPRLCRSGARCGEGQACLHGQCRSDAETEAPGLRRIVVAPASMACVLSDGGDRGLPAAAPLGASIGTRARLLVEFPTGAWTPSAVERAYLVLEREPGAQVGPGDVVVRAAAIIEPWSARGGVGASWASAPKTDPASESAALVAARGSGAIRIDVTAYAARLAVRTDRSWGLLVEGAGSGLGVAIATGAGSAPGPRLEVFVR